MHQVLHSAQRTNMHSGMKLYMTDVILGWQEALFRWRLEE